MRKKDTEKKQGRLRQAGVHRGRESWAVTHGGASSTVRQVRSAVDEVTRATGTKLCMYPTADNREGCSFMSMAKSI
jgi:hypothetical protein